MLELTTTHSKSIFSNPESDEELGRILKIGESEIMQQVAPNLSVEFSKEILNILKGMEDCEGIRLYPAIENDKLVMIAGGVDSFNNDLVNSNHFCGIGYSDGTPSRIITLNEGKERIVAEGSTSGSIEDLRTLQQTPESGKVFKARFDNEFLETVLEANDIIRFEVAEFNFGNEGKQRTIVATTFNSSMENELMASLLPCPPHCGGGSGSYIPEVFFVDENDE